MFYVDMFILLIMIRYSVQIVNYVYAIVRLLIYIVK